MRQCEDGTMGVRENEYKGRWAYGAVVQIYTLKRNSVCLCASSKTTRATGIKLGTINHHSLVSIIRVLVTIAEPD